MDPALQNLVRNKQFGNICKVAAKYCRQASDMIASQLAEFDKQPSPAHPPPHSNIPNPSNPPNPTKKKQSEPRVRSRNSSKKQYDTFFRDKEKELKKNKDYASTPYLDYSSEEIKEQIEKLWMALASEDKKNYGSIEQTEPAPKVPSKRKETESKQRKYSSSITDSDEEPRKKKTK